MLSYGIADVFLIVLAKPGLPSLLLKAMLPLTTSTCVRTPDKCPWLTRILSSLATLPIYHRHSVSNLPRSVLFLEFISILIGHYIENVGNTTLKFLEVLKTGS